jgi:hypothetical protein
MIGIVLGAALAGLTAGQAGPPMPVDALLEQVFRNGVEQRYEAQRRGLTCIKVQEGSETGVWLVTYDSGHEWQKRTMKNGRPVSEPAKQPNVEISSEWAANYTFAWADPPQETDEHGVRLLVIKFEPRNPDRKAENDEELFVYHMTGKVYVDPERLLIVRIEGRLFKSFKYNLVTRVTEVRFVMHYEPVDGLMMVASIDTVVRFSALGFDGKRQYHVRYRDFKRQSP